MTWPFGRRRVVEDLREEVGRFAALYNQATHDALYWRTRAEQAIDALLARSGVPAPIMEQRKPAPVNPLLGAMAGLGIGEIESKAKPQ